MRMRAALSLMTFLTYLLIEGCASGPRLRGYVSDPKDGIFAFRTKGRPNDPIEVVGYTQSRGFSVYPPQSLQAVEQYCAGRDDVGTAAPAFTVCLSEPASGGLSCSDAECQLNSAQNGAICLASPSSPPFVLYADSLHYVALSPPDQETLLGFCGIELNEVPQ